MGELVENFADSVLARVVADEWAASNGKTEIRRLGSHKELGTYFEKLNPGGQLIAPTPSR